MPLFFRVGAVIAILIAIGVVVIGVYRERSRAAFNLKSEHTKLSTDVVSEVSGYERLESENGVAKYLIKADFARTFSDQHLELQNVYFELYDEAGTKDYNMSGESGLYIPEEEKNFHAYLKGNVNIETRDRLKLKAEDLSYSTRDGKAEVTGKLEFERDNVRGHSTGATALLNEKRLDLAQDVQIETFEGGNTAETRVKYAQMNSGHAMFDQIANRIDLDSNVAIKVDTVGRSTNINSARASVNFIASSDEDRSLRTFELFDSVRIVSKDATGSSATTESGYALYDKPADRYELKQSARIELTSGERTSKLNADEAVYEQTALKIALTGNAEVVQGDDFLKGSNIFADLYASRKIKSAIARGNASGKQVSKESVLDISAPELNADFAENGDPQNANAIGASRAQMTPLTDASYTSVIADAGRGIGILFKAGELMDTFRTDGRTTIQLNVPAREPDSANKKLSADAVKTTFAVNGKDIKKAEAVGNAELLIEPIAANARNYRTAINAPRFDCDFFQSGNNAELCTASKKVKAVRTPSVAVDGKGAQTITSEVLIARFSPKSNDVAVLEASGNSKYNELDRNGLAAEMSFTQADEIIRLRGGEPTVWDNRGRAKAREIDIDTRNERSALRGGVSTTYYSRKQIGQSTPFSKNDTPIFLTGDAAEFDHRAETAVYTGNARSWQENNYVRGDRLMLDQRKGTFLAQGNVQSQIYTAKLRQKGKESDVPTSASAGSLAFDRNQRVLQYRTAVDIRQGTDRITAESADVYLNESNDLIKTIAQNKVTITQANRRASGDWAEYSAELETAVLRGSPATVSDQENGSTQSGQITLSMRENKLVSEAKTKSSTPTRNRSVHKIKESKP